MSDDAAAIASAQAPAQVRSVALRCILDQRDTQAWQVSATYTDFLRFLGALLTGVEGRATTSIADASPLVSAVTALLDEVGALINEYPPIVQPMRFGNRAFRDWHARLLRELPRLCRALPGIRAGCELELASYLADSFGNSTRLDYGTGHETCFFFFLYALGRVGALSADDAPALGLRVFPAYIRVARSLQRTYGLEPAGSHGVWALDDYFFLTFIIGACQLKGGAHGGPSALLEAASREAMRAEFLYADALDAIMHVKRGAPFAEHSPMLAELAGLGSWAKVADALAKLYRAEVLGKFPVAQHFLFGELFPADWTPSRAPVPSDSGAALEKLNTIVV
jgi:hypothetical protein